MSSNSKRIVFVAPPGYGHAFPMMPLAKTLEDLGHRILMATCGVALPIASGAGFTPMDVTPGIDLPQVYQRFIHAFGHRAEEDAFFITLGELMLDGVLRAASEFRADVIIHTHYAAAGAVAAAALGIPRIFLGVGLAQTPESMMQSVYLPLAEIRMPGLSIPPAGAWIDVAPPSLVERREVAWPMEYLPYNGRSSGTRRSDSNRPRIAVTIGTVVPSARGLGALNWLGDVARQIPAEFIVAHGSLSDSELGSLPSNVSTAAWIPMDALLATCSAAIHHAGSGTMLTALKMGLPQIVMPQGADQFFNAAALERSGAGLVRPEEPTRSVEDDVSLVRRLLDDDSLRHSAAAVRREMESMPPPTEVASRILCLLDSFPSRDSGNMKHSTT